MAEDVPAFDDLPSFDQLPDAPESGTQAASSAVPKFDDLPSFDEMPHAEGAAMTAARSGANAILPGAAALSGFGVGAELAAPTAPFTYGIGPVVGGLVGAGIAAYGASKIQGGIKEAVGLDDSAQVALNAEEHPIASAVGETVGGMAGMGPAGSLAQRAIGAGLQTAIEGGEQAYRGEFDPTKLAIGAIGGAAFPTPNRVGQVVENAGRAAARKVVPGRPNPPADPAADTAHQAVGDPAPDDPHASAFGDPPPAVGEAQVETTGNPQSAPTRSERDYGKGKDTNPEGDMLTQGDVAPDVGAALKEAAPEPAPAQEAPPAPAAPEAPAPPVAQSQALPPPAAAMPPKATDAIAKSVGRNRNKGGPKLPEPVVDAGFPKEGEPLAVGENEATKMPQLKGKTADGDSVTDAQKAAGNYPKARTHDFGKPQKVETLAGDIRRSPADSPVKWENVSPYDYGYFNKTIGKDKDHIDFARPVEGSPEHGDKHFIVDQRNPDTGKFDEHKVFTYYKDEAAARKHYAEGFSDNKGPERLGAIKEISRGELVKVLAKHTSKPWKTPYSMVEEKAAKPLAERAVVKDLIAKGKTTPEAIAQLPPEQVEAAIAGKRTRKYGVGTGASAGYPVEGLVNSEGKPVTANTKAKAAERSAMHKGVVDWFKASAPKKADESNGELLDRLKGAPEPTYKPAHKPAEWMLAREAKQVLSKPTPARIKKFKEAERMLRGAPEDVNNYRGGKRVEADIANSKRSGDEAIAGAEAKNVDQGRNTVEDEMVAAIDAKRGGRFDVPHEEAETMVKPQPVKTAADLKEIPHKTVNSHDEALGKIDTNAISKKALSEADAALVGRKATEKNVPSEERKAGDVKKPIKVIDDAEKARIMAEMNKAAKRNERAKGDTDALPLERDPTVLPAKRTRDLFDRVINEGKGFIGDETASLNPGKIKADVKRLMNTLTKTSDHDSYIAAESKGAVDDYARSLGDVFQSLRGEYTNHKLRLNQEGNAIPSALNNPQAMREIFKAREKDSAHIPVPNGAASHIDNLNSALKALYDQHLKPRFDQNDRIAALIRQDHPDMIGADVEHHIQRLREGDTDQFNILMSNDDPTSPMYNALKVHADAAQDRKFYALERTADGKRVIIAPTDKGYDYHVKGKIHAVTDPKFEFEANKPYKAGSHDTIMRQATTDEIMKHVLDSNKKPMAYYQNAGFAANITNLQLGEMLRNLNTLKDIRNSPEFKAFSTTNEGKAKKETPQWEEPTLPNFKGTYVHPAIKAALDDYAGIPQNALRRFASAVTKTLFWMPTAHIDNVGAHWLSARGYENFTPQGMKRLMQTAPKAFKSVINQDAFQAEMRREGAGLIYGGVLTRKPVEQLARTFQMDIKRNPSKWGPIADKLGVPLRSLGGMIYDNASKVMWSVNDILLTQRVMELQQQGKSLKHAITDAERDIPNYRLPIKIMGSRMLQQALSDPLKVAFGRYHYGMFNSYANQFKDLLGNKATPGDRLAAAGRLMTTGLLLTVLYPMVWDKGAQWLTGNPDAKAQRRGPASIPDKLIDAVHGKTDVMSAARSSLTLPPLTTTALETLQNRDFRGKPIVEPGDMAGTATQKGRAALQFGAHIAKGLISPLSTISTNAQKDVSPLGAIRDQATDVKNPSKGAVKYEKLIGMHNQRDTIQRFKKGGSDPIEGAYNKLFGYK